MRWSESKWFNTKQKLRFELENIVQELLVIEIIRMADI